MLPTGDYCQEKETCTSCSYLTQLDKCSLGFTSLVYENTGNIQKSITCKNLKKLRNIPL